MSAMPPDLAQAWALRRPERVLLLWCLLCMAIGFALVLGSVHAEGRTLTGNDLLPLLSYALALVGVHLFLVLTRFRGDQLLVGAVAFLAGFGLLAQYRLGAFNGQDGLALYLFPGGVLVMLLAIGAFMGGRYRVLGSWPWVWGGLSLVLVAVLLVTGQRFRGGVYAAGLITPTEALKISVILFLTGYLARYGQALGDWGRRLYVPLPPWRPLWPLAAFWVTLTGLLLAQRDLGMVVILSLTLLVLLTAGTRRIGYLVYGLLAAGGLGYLVIEVFEHGQRRIEAWQDPFEDPTGDGWQILQGLSGMYSGGLWGEGFGQGSPGYTPIAGSDFVYSVVGEELGFVGCVLVLLFFLVIFARGLRIARHAADRTGMLLAGGVTAVLATQTFLNVGGVTKLVPLTGITLPFISHGGASLLTAFTALGLLLAVSDTATNSPRKSAQTQAGPKPKAKPRARTRAPAPAPVPLVDEPPDETEAGPAPHAAPKPAPRRKRAPKRARAPEADGPD